MDKKLTNQIVTTIQWAIILVANLFFVCKYIPRIGFNPILSALVYSAVFCGAIYIYRHFFKKYISERFACFSSLLLTIGLLTVIACCIFFIDPLTIQVDRWSATTYFLDALFSGIYPYGVHTHVSEMNFPSPFPLWHYLNIPFWLIGDVGWIQAFFLLFFLFSVYLYFRSWRAVLNTLLLLYLSPAYWWELATRSDGLSNALLICSLILLLERYTIKMDKQWWLLAIFAGCLASTRLSAVIPVALYLFKPWIDAPWKIKIGFVAVAASVVICAFAPYVFWDTENWVFFHRNPFMSQTEPGNPWILGIMVLLAIGIAYKKQTFYYYVSTTSAFMFAFMLIANLGVMYSTKNPSALLDSTCDISYFTLAIPYAIVALVYQYCAWMISPLPLSTQMDSCASKLSENKL